VHLSLALKAFMSLPASHGPVVGIAIDVFVFGEVGRRFWTRLNAVRREVGCSVWKR